MDETLGEAFEADGEDGATDAALQQVFAESGLELSQSLGSVGVNKERPCSPDLAERLQRLRT
jgi:hypothetical protein